MKKSIKKNMKEKFIIKRKKEQKNIKYNYEHFKNKI